MAIIHILDSETIDKIAAGEVVERPASVVKELVENAVDAGAGAVTVEIKDGGIELIRVTDNGCGMEREQLRRAFLRHATSKIESADDLMRISSLGFRGEALSSIAAVAKVEVATKVADSLTGSRILLEGGKEVSFDEVGVPEGTTFIVRHLFFNTPVRRKFLKQPATEGGYIVALMEHLALSRPDISFKLLLGSQMRFHTTGNGDLREVIYRIYGREIAGALIPIQEESHGIRVEGYLGKPIQVRSNRNFEIYFINGRFIRSNIISKALEEGYKQYLMQHKFPLCVLHITMEASSVDVNVHPTKMDVRFSDAIGFCNFLTESVRNTLRRQEMIPEALLSTEQELRAARLAEAKNRDSKSTPEPFEQKRSSAYRVMEEAQYTKSQSPKQDFTHNPVWNRVKNVSPTEEVKDMEELATDHVKMDLSADRTELASQEEFFTETSELLILPSDEKSEITLEKSSDTESGNKSVLQEKYVSSVSDLKNDTAPEANSDAGITRKTLPNANPSVSITSETAPGTNSGAGITRKTLPDANPSVSITNEILPGTNSGVSITSETTPEANSSVSTKIQIPQDGNSTIGLKETTLPVESQLTNGVQLDLFEEKILTLKNRYRFRIIGQVFETYWLVEFEDKMLMIDQHAAHEKVNYERLIKQYQENAVLSQNLLPPVIVSLSGQEETVLKEHMDSFAALGFEVEDFGGSEYALRSVPTDLYGCNEQEMFLEVLEGLAEGSALKSSEGGTLRVIEEKIASMSCKAAVKGNNRLSFAEAEALIDELLTLDNPYNCPHGRPTMVTITKKEMERKFKRIVS